jgi:hypothetical protein
MKKVGQLILALLAVMLLSMQAQAQRGHGGPPPPPPPGGRDSVIRHEIDSLDHIMDSLNHLRDTLPPPHLDTLPPHRDSLPPHHGWGGVDTTTPHGLGNGGRGRIDINRLLGSDSCLLDLEALMTAADAASLQADLAAVKSDGTQLEAMANTLRTEVDSLRKLTPPDTASIHLLLSQFRVQSQALLTDEQAKVAAISTLLATYTTQIQQVWVTCTAPPPHHGGTGQNGDSTLHLMVAPLFPNPVSLTRGSAQVNLQYNLSLAAAVNITVSDAQGNVVLTPANDQETAGLHTIQISITSLKVGIYFVRVQAGTLVQTQKLVVMN